MNATMKWTVDPVQSLERLSTSIRNKAMRISLNAAAAPVKAAVIASAPVDQGHLAKATIIRVRNYKAGNVWVAIVGAGSRYKRLKKVKGKTVRRINKKSGQVERVYVKPSKYQKFVDQGTSNISGRHYLTAAFQRSKAQFQQTAMRKLKEVIEAEMGKK